MQQKGEMSLLIILFLVALALQFMYLGSYTIAFSLYKTRNSTTEENSSVSVIVCAFNELENLKKLIPKLLSQLHKSFEIIIVNDQSSDGSYEYLLELKEQYAHLKLVEIDYTPDHFSRKKYAVTLGIKAATYDKIVFTDADCYPSSDNWLSSVSSQYAEKTKIVIGASLYEKQKGFLNQFIQFETYWTAIQYLGCAMMKIPYMGVGRNLSYDKSLFLENRGFDTHQKVIGGDDDLFVNTHANGTNTKVILGEESLTYSYPKSTWQEFFRQKKRHLSVGRFYKRKHQIILGIYSLSYLLYWGTVIGLIFVYPLAAGLGFLIRMAMIYLMFFIASKKIGKVYSPLILPVLDFVFGFYYIATTVSSVFSKSIKWK